MKVHRLFAAGLVAATLFAVPAGAFAASPVQQQQKPSVTAHPQVDPDDKTYPTDKIVTATVHDAWLLSGKNEEAFFDIVQQLAQFSAEKRGLTLPDTAAAGRRMGEMIKTRAKTDHDQLLYAIVDQAVRTLGVKTVASAAK
jgi:hypothetical protein